LRDLVGFNSTPTERAIRRAKRDRPIYFVQKGHKDQFIFNADIEDRLEATAKKMRKLLRRSLKSSKRHTRSSKKVWQSWQNTKSISTLRINQKSAGRWWQQEGRDRGQQRG